MSTTGELIANMNNLSNSINKYFGVSLAPLGIVFNLITILTFSLIRLERRSTMTVFFTALCIYDILSLSNLLIIITLPAYGIQLVNTAGIVCKIMQVLRRTLVSSPSWIQVLITFDRFRMIVCQQKFKFITDKKKLKIILGKTLNYISENKLRKK